jgi:hypothetical protein
MVAVSTEQRAFFPARYLFIVLNKPFQTLKHLFSILHVSWKYSWIFIVYTTDRKLRLEWNVIQLLRNTSHTCRKKHLNGLLWRRCSATQSVNTLSPDFPLCCLWTIRLLLTNQIACCTYAEYGSLMLLSKNILSNVAVKQHSDRIFNHCRLDWTDSWEYFQ